MVGPVGKFPHFPTAPSGTWPPAHLSGFRGEFLSLSQHSLLSPASPDLLLPGCCLSPSFYYPRQPPDSVCPLAPPPPKTQDAETAPVPPSRPPAAPPWPACSVGPWLSFPLPDPAPAARRLRGLVRALPGRLSPSPVTAAPVSAGAFSASLPASLSSPQAGAPGDCADIIGGEKSVPHSRPFMAALMRDNVFECGGTLINTGWVLTAAHCRIKKGNTVILGAYSLTKYEKEKQEFQVTEKFPHQFNKITFENDIMLLKLNKEANITQAVKPIMLPTTYDDVMAQTQCLVVGWGSTKNGGSTSDILREGHVAVMDRRICNDKQHYNGKYVTFKMLCAGGVKDTCHGDSGGPLICGGIQRGITSFGEPGKCGHPKYPGVYTRLTKRYLRWIKKTVGH